MKKLLDIWNKASKKYYKKNRLTILQKKKNYYKDNIELMEERREKRKEYTKVYQREWCRKRRKIDPYFKIKRNLRARVYSVLKGKHKDGSAVKDLGCTVSEFKNYIEGLWLKGMSWDNYGNKKNQWSIDHIKAISLFDLSKREELITVCHYTNLQPMWHIDNIRKGNKICVS